MLAVSWFCTVRVTGQEYWGEKNLSSLRGGWGVPNYSGTPEWVVGLRRVSKSKHF